MEVYCENKFNNKVLSRIVSYSLNKLNVVLEVKEEKYTFRLFFLNLPKDNEIEFLKVIRTLYYKFQFFIYSIQIDSLTEISIKLKYKEFDRFPSIYCSKTVNISDKNTYCLEELHPDRNYIKFSVATSNLYREKEKEVFDSIMKHYGKFVVITD